MYHLVFVYTAYQWIEVKAFMQSHCTIQNKLVLIVIDLSIDSCGEFEFTVKTVVYEAFKGGINNFP